MQGKLVFYDVRADGAKVQVMADVATSGGDLAAFVALHNGVKIGDIIGVEGFPGTRHHHSLCSSLEATSSCYCQIFPSRRL